MNAYPTGLSASPSPMAGFTAAETVSSVLVRMAEPEWTDLLQLLFWRYPNAEWATFARFGWRDTPEGLVVTLAGIDGPEPMDMDETVEHVAIQGSYQRRIAMAAEAHEFAVGVIHSHPAGARTEPSAIDDDMDAFLSDFLSTFAPERPYISLILASDGKHLSGSGRAWWRGNWHHVARFACEGTRIVLKGFTAPAVSAPQLRRVARLASAFSEEAAARLEQSVVAVLGASGTGSPVIEALARAGVGHVIVVDPDRLVASNIERVHGSYEDDVPSEPLKVALAKRHIHAINPGCHVTALCGALPQSAVIDALVHADLVIGCTDRQHGRVALSDLAVRYLVPAIDCSVTLEGAEGRIDAQVFQVVRFHPSDPCVYCQQMVDARRLDQELVSPEERAKRKAAAQAAVVRGEAPDPYWRAMAQIHTVGYLTMLAGALAVGYGIGFLSGRFSMPFIRLQGDLLAPALGTIEVPSEARPLCSCRRSRGSADQGLADAFISAPGHWPPPRVFE